MTKKAAAFITTRGRLTLVANNDFMPATPLELLVEMAGLKESNITDLELVRLRAKNAAVREAWGAPGTAEEN